MALTITGGGHVARLTHHPWLPATIPEDEVALALQLRQGTVLAIRGRRPLIPRWRRRAGSRLRLECLAGELWVTVEGGGQDHLLSRGQSMEAPLEGTTVVQAMWMPASVAVTELAPEHGATTTGEVRGMR